MNKSEKTLYHYLSDKLKSLHEDYLRSTEGSKLNHEIEIRINTLNTIQSDIIDGVLKLWKKH